MSITLLIREAKWRSERGLGARLKNAAQAALDEGGVGSLTILLTGDEHLRALNLAFRKKDEPTNVLSFPALRNDETYLGDIAIAYGVTAKEAKSSGKTLADHACHLAVHGVLHLLGFDHERAKDAGIMERLETKILTGLKIADPYPQRAARP